MSRHGAGFWGDSSDGRCSCFHPWKLSSANQGGDSLAWGQVSRVLSLPSLRTLRDSLSGWDPETLARLLREELRAYKAVRANTGQERFNVICDLLELSPEETPAGAWARATHLVELAQVLCYHNFAQQTDW